MGNAILTTQPSKKNIAYEGIKQMIIEGELKHDTPLVERQLCEILNVSRTPVREALRELANNDMVEIVENKGVYVKKIDFKDMVEIFELREALECLTIQLFVKRATDEEITELGKLVAEQEGYYNNNEHALFMKTDMKMHNYIAEVAQNARIRNAVFNIYDQISQMALAAKDEAMIIEMAVNAHREMYKSIKEHDEENAIEAMRKHVSEVKDFYKERFYIL
ncbi:MAG: GntR family transcriptional regulator [Suipraeoptans sp.]